MANGHFQFKEPKNEAVLSFAKGSSERKNVKAALKYAKSQSLDIPMVINGQEIFTKEKVSIHPPHEIKHTLGHFSQGNSGHVKDAIRASLKARKKWSAMPWEQRASIFLKAADLLAGKYRWEMLAATMLGQSKNAFQAEIDSTCELIDFLRFNVHFVNEIYKQQPLSTGSSYNRLEYRPLEGFTLAVSPFNFTAIGGNLPTCMAMCGNVVVWKPADTQIYSAHVFMKILKEAGLPDGVINMVFADGPDVSKVCLNHADFAGVHFTGSTRVFNLFWEMIGTNIGNYKTYPRIVGETGGKDFVVVHPSAIMEQVVAGLCRGAYEFQGQKCSAASRAYIPKSMWKKLKPALIAEINSMKVGTVEDFRNFVNAIIDEKAFDSITAYIDGIKKEKGSKILTGGSYNKSKGYFIDPTLVEAKNSQATTMCEEIFGPVLTVHIYDDKDFSKILGVVDKTSPYALTGSIFAEDRYAVAEALEKLENSAGNFYINDKPSGSVVGQQPFGGARASGTNDKAGSMLNLFRWMSPRTVKETFNAPIDYRYPFLEEK